MPYLPSFHVTVTSNYNVQAKLNIFIGDVLGYLTIWEVSELVGDTSNSIHQVVSWRGHNSKVTSVVLRPHKKLAAIYSASADGSVRLVGWKFWKLWLGLQFIHEWKIILLIYLALLYLSLGPTKKYVLVYLYESLQNG